MNCETKIIRVGLYRSDPIYYGIGESGPIGVNLPENLSVWTLAHGISQINRFAGQTPEPYNVAEHSIRLRHMVDKRYGDVVLNRAALMHDIPECLGINDLNSSIKRLLAPRIRLLEAEVMWRVWSTLAFKAPQKDTPISWDEAEAKIKPLDSELGDNEYRYLFDFAKSVRVPVEQRPSFLSAEEAREAWLSLWTIDGGVI